MRSLLQRSPCRLRIAPELQAWLRKTTLDQRLAQRARILLELDAALPREDQ